MTLEAVILAAGKGTRMRSIHPKVLHAVGGKSMLEHVLDTTRALDVDNIHIVVGYGAEQIEKRMQSRTEELKPNLVLQAEQLGTGHAVQQALPHVDTGAENNSVIVLYADVPLIAADTLRQLLALGNTNSVSILTLLTEDPTGLGRIIRDESNAITAIVEEKDASAEQKQLKEINTGIMVLPAIKLNCWLQKISNNNAQGEYYLTDIIAIAFREGCEINGLIINDAMQVQGVNDKAQLAILERHYQMTITDKLLEQGVTLLDPARIDVRGELLCGADVKIDVNVIFEGEVSLGDGVNIGANTVIKDAKLGAGVQILTGTIIDGAIIGDNASVGPYARIRPGTILKEDVKVGNFVETKNAVLGRGTKASHLAYIGDAVLGENVNVGAGTIVCNYDGVNKHKTKIGNDVFVGSNSVLIAPVEIANGAFIAAGSAINNDVPTDHLAVGRSKQRNISGWKRPQKSELP